MCYGTCTMTSLVISTEKVDGYRQTKVSTHKENDLDFGYKKTKTFDLEKNYPQKCSVMCADVQCSK